MRKLKLAVWALWLFALAISCNKKADDKRTEQVSNIDSLKLSELTSYAWSHWLNVDSVETPYTSSKTFSDFDFYRLAPFLDSVNVKSKVTVYYANKEIVKLYKSSGHEDNDFVFKVFKNMEHNYTVLLTRNFHEEELRNQQEEPVKGFIILFKGHCYFVGFAKDPFCIMELDNHLKATSTLRFCSNKLIYRTKVTYHGGNVYSDILSTPVKPMTITEETLFSDVVKQFGTETKFKFEREMKVGWLEEWGDLPLWDYNGRHEYEKQLNPSHKELPYPELLFNCLIRRKK